jgi:hypothetical protein
METQHQRPKGRDSRFWDRDLPSAVEAKSEHGAGPGRSAACREVAAAGTPWHPREACLPGRPPCWYACWEHSSRCAPTHRMRRNSGFQAVLITGWPEKLRMTARAGTPRARTGKCAAGAEGHSAPAAVVELRRRRYGGQSPAVSSPQVAKVDADSLVNP